MKKKIDTYSFSPLSRHHSQNYLYRVSQPLKVLPVPTLHTHVELIEINKRSPLHIIVYLENVLLPFVSLSLKIANFLIGSAILDSDTYQ